MFIIVKVKEKTFARLCLNSLFKPRGLHGSSRAESGRSFLCLPPNRGEVQCPAVHSLGTAWAHVSPQALFAAAAALSAQGSGSQFLAYDSSDSRCPTEMSVCPCVSVISVTTVHRSAWSGCLFL